MTLMAAAGAAGVARARRRRAAVQHRQLAAGRRVEGACRCAPGRLRTRLHRLMLGSRAPLGPGHAARQADPQVRDDGPRLGAASMVEACARIVHACPRGVRAAWAQVLGRPRSGRAAYGEWRVPDRGRRRHRRPAHPARCTPARWPPRCRDCLGLTELPGLGHMTPVEDAGAVAGGCASSSRTICGRDRTGPATDGRPTARAGEGGDGMSSERVWRARSRSSPARRAGVGELLARKLSARGAKVALVGLEPDELKQVAERLHSRERPLVRRRHRPRGDGAGRARRSRSASGRSTSSSPTRGWRPAVRSSTPTRRPGGGSSRST